jgi:hypothetical protein
MHFVTKSGSIFWEVCQVFFCKKVLNKYKKEKLKAKMLQKAEVKKHFGSNKKVRKFKGFEFPRGLILFWRWDV